MKKPAFLVSMLALAATILPPVLFLAGQLEAAPMKGVMLASALIWFVAWPVANREES
ncbi:MAG: hypothetical protein ACQKBY_04715 [Verrucomicrobiales bacterium]